MRNKEIVKGFFRDVFEKPGFDEAVLKKRVDEGYVQHVDGKALNHDAFIGHIKQLKEKLASCDIQFKTLVEEGEIVFSNHVLNFTLKDGAQGKSHVIAEFRLRSGKLFYCDELTFLVSGESENQDLGSVY